MASVLLIVDVQKGFVTDCSRHVVAPIEKLQQRFAHVIATKFYNPDPSPFRDILGYDKLAPGSPETSLAFLPAPGAIIVERPLYTCVNEELRRQLQRMDATEVYVCGIATEACVLKTALDLFEDNLRCWILRDLCASDQGDKYHIMALELIGKLIKDTHLIDSRVLYEPAKVSHGA